MEVLPNLENLIAGTDINYGSSRQDTKHCNADTISVSVYLPAFADNHR